MRTFSPKLDEIDRHWLIIDANGKTLGRLASEVANLLRGKNKPEYTPHLDCGDYVIVINAENVKVTGKKENQKLYRRHSGFPHGFKEETLRALRERRPVAIIERAVRGMIPHSRLGDHQFTNLKVYAGAQHPHEAQQPKLYDLALRRTVLEQREAKGGEEPSKAKVGKRAEAASDKADGEPQEKTHSEAKGGEEPSAAKREKRAEEARDEADGAVKQ